MVYTKYLSHSNAFALHDLGISIPCVESHRGAFMPTQEKRLSQNIKGPGMLNPLPNKPCLMQMRFRKQRKSYV